VFAVRDGRARIVNVELGARSGLAAQVLEGIDPGDHVIIYPGEKIQDGSSVEAR